MVLYSRRTNRFLGKHITCAPRLTPVAARGLAELGTK